MRLVPVSRAYATEIFSEFTEDITTYMTPKAPTVIDETLEFIDRVVPNMEAGEELALVILRKNTGEFLGGGVYALSNQPHPRSESG